MPAITRRFSTISAKKTHPAEKRLRGYGHARQSAVCQPGRYWWWKDPTKILCYTDGLVELIEGDGVEFGTTFIEQEISNDGTIDENIHEIIKLQKIDEGSDRIFDDISILGISLSGE